MKGTMVISFLSFLCIKQEMGTYCRYQLKLILENWKKKTFLSTHTPWDGTMELLVNHLDLLHRNLNSNAALSL